MKRLVGFSLLGICAWALLTIMWAAAAHLANLPGPGEAAAASMNFAAGTVTAVDLPGPLGAPQRVAARQLRRSGRVAARFYRGPERAVGRVLDRAFGHSHAHLSRSVRLAPRARVVLPLQEADRARIQRQMEEMRRRLAEVREREVEVRRRVEHRRHDAARVRIELEQKREILERLRREMERGNKELLEKLDREEGELNGLGERIRREILREIERELERLEIDGTITVEPSADAPRLEVTVEGDGSSRVIRIGG